MPAIDFSLCLVTDRTQTGGRPRLSLLRDALGAGLQAIQLRETDRDTPGLISLAKDLQAHVRDRGARLLINDRVDVALVLGTAGVHLRANSLPVAVARRLLGPHLLVGVSTHSVDEVVRAEADGADLAFLGPVYTTASKRGYEAPLGLRPLEEASTRSRLPVFAIGGITAARVHEVRRAGASGVAVISAVLGAADVAAATRELLDALAAPC